MRRDHASHDGMKLPRWIRRWVYIAGTACLASGVLWLIYHYFIQHEGEFGLESHPLEHIWLILHGGAGFLMTWVFGLIWLAHVRRGWQKGRNRVSGLTMASVMIALALSGWGLYYLSDENWRNVTSILHWGLGIFGGLWLPFHIWRGRRGAN